LRITLLNLACIYVWVHCLLNESYTIEASIFRIKAVNSHFHLYGCSYHHNCIDECSCEAEDDTVANCLEYYD
jgi:hypothetical protein